MTRQLPSFDDFKVFYDIMVVDAPAASAIAGLNRAVKNACAVRICYAFNKLTGHAIPRKPRGVHGHVFKGSGKKYYILGSRGMANYITKTYGKPQILKPSERPSGVGICYFKVTTWTDAYGHVAIWDGTECYYGEYFKESKEVWFWKMETKFKTARAEL